MNLANWACIALAIPTFWILGAAIFDVLRALAQLPPEESDDDFSGAMAWWADLPGIRGRK